MIIINGKNHWPQDIEWAVEQLPGFKAGRHRRLRHHHARTARKHPPSWSIAAPPTMDERCRLRDQIRANGSALITGMNCVVELVPPRTLPRTSSSGKLSRSKARNALSVGAYPAAGYCSLSFKGLRRAGLRPAPICLAGDPKSTPGLMRRPNNRVQGQAPARRRPCHFMSRP
jgi:hypothetical protein